MARWKAVGRGFRVASDVQGGPATPVADLILWADNAWILAGSECEAVETFQELSLEMHDRLHLRWKPSSLKLMRVVRAPGEIWSVGDRPVLPLAAALRVPPMVG